MLKILFFLVLYVVLATSRESPNADYVKHLMLTSNGSQISSDVANDATLDVPGLLYKYQYPIEVHHTVTSDGYILELHRIPHGKTNGGAGARPAVLVMHGLLSSSADFVLMGPGKGLAYHLADAGYDVWLANARGNYYSRKHVSLSPDDKDFWRFSWDEIGNYDLPALIDYVTFTAGKKKLHYIGHSQGGTSFLVLNSLRPEYNEKIISFQGLAPAAFFTNNENSLFNTLSGFETIIETAAFSLNRMEIFGSRDFLNWFYSTYCLDQNVFLLICKRALGGLFVSGNVNTTMIPVILGHTPAGASIRQVAHYGQVIRFDAFRRYNHNALLNLAFYGSITPPYYNLSLVKAPSYIHYGLADKEVDYRDAIELAKKLPNVKKLNQVPRETFNHFDFIWGIDVVDQLYNPLVSMMREAEKH